ncbi:hypothetical protein OE88DRAFT_596016 [Heliocybe sulcata]|uniref:CCHC-type domain-containing protein n=1 Tax=Heliocybe sulcata TaxID=5364 RepID=A0A5C3MRP6_9AGAM|nr:hypothetical protein OE88DRAFT_596016 [Heliocybe sulcata]
MSSGYNLRSTKGRQPALPVVPPSGRTGAGAKGTSRGSNTGETDSSLASLTSSDSESTVSAPAVTPGRSYAQAVTARSPSAPVSVKEALASSRDGITGNSGTIENNKHNYKTTMVSEPESDEGGPWTRVSHRRGRSLDSPVRMRIPRGGQDAGARKDAPSVRTDLSATQQKAVEDAMKSMTDEQRARVRKRAYVVRTPTGPSEGRSPSPEAGPSRPKGKAVDPSNWGAAGLNESDVDVETQRQMLDSFANVHQARQAATRSRSGTAEGASNAANRPSKEAPVQSKKDRLLALQAKMARLESEIASDQASEGERRAASKPNKNKKTTRGVTIHSPDAIIADMANKTRKGRKSRSPVPLHRNTNMQPVSQLDKKSYLGRAFEKVGKHNRPDSSDDSGGASSPSSPSSSSSSDSDGSSDSSSSSEDSSPHRKASKKHKSSKKKSKSKKGKSLLKPIAPNPYDGTADTRQFLKFMTESIAYVKDGRVRRRRRIPYIAHYLEGKAHDFYTRTVSVNAGHWKIDKFFRELFNYCFPIDYRCKLRQKLRKCYQNDKNVREYVYELTEFYTMLGVDSERDRVTKLWDGLNKDIQSELWRNRLNPEVSTWEEVVKAAEIIELSFSVNKTSPRDDKRSSESNKQKSGSSKTNRTHRDNKQSGAGKDRPKVEQRPGASSGPSGSRSSGSGWRPQLSNKEREELKASGKCFKCQETGHLARNCPKGLNVKSNKSGKAPGLTNFNVEMDLQEAEELRGLADTTETINDITLGNMEWAEPTRTFRPSWSKHTYREDPLAKRCEDLLCRGAPYPGDDEHNMDEEHGVYAPSRFCVYQTTIR